MKKWLVTLVALMLVVVLAACGGKEEDVTAGAGASPAATEAPKAEASPSAAPEAAAELTITHASGETVVPKNPKNVVVFDFSSLETLDKLGVEVLGVPQANVPAHLAKYKEATYQNAGGLMEPDFEKIAGMKPELIIISGRQAASYEEFKKIAPTINMALDTKKYLESFKQNVTTLASIFGKEEAAQQELAKIEESVKQVKAKAEAAEAKKGLIVLVTGGKVSAYGSASRFGIIHDELGVAEVDPSIDVSTHGMKISFEFIAEKNPDYLFVVDRDAVVQGGGQTAKEVVENSLVKNTNAYKENQIVYLSPAYWYIAGGGLMSVEEMVKEVGIVFK